MNNDNVVITSIVIMISLMVLALYFADNLGFLGEFDGELYLPAVERFVGRYDAFYEHCITHLERSITECQVMASGFAGS